MSLLLCLHCNITAKLAERGSSVEGKSQLDKTCGGHKKPDTEKNNCQCACHNKSDTTTATSAGGPAVLDLTHSPCKGKSQPATSVAEHGKQFRMSGFFFVGITFIEPIVHILSLSSDPFFIYYCFFHKQHKSDFFCQLVGADIFAFEFLSHTFFYHEPVTSLYLP